MGWKDYQIEKKCMAFFCSINMEGKAQMGEGGRDEEVASSKRNRIED